MSQHDAVDMKEAAVWRAANNSEAAPQGSTLGDLYDRLIDLHKEQIELDRLVALRNVGQSSDWAVRSQQETVDLKREVEVPGDIF